MGDLAERVKGLPFWDYGNRMTSAIRKNSEEIPQVTIEYTYCGTCGGALRTRKKTDETGTVTSWLRFEYEGINLLRIDERYDDDTPVDGIDSEDPWRVINTYVHAPGQIGNVVRAYWYRYSWDNAPTPCASGSWVPCYDALGNQIGVVESTNGKFYRWEIDAYGNSLEDTDVFSNDFASLDSEAPKCHLTGKFVDPDTGYAYFYARWLDMRVGRFVGRDRSVCRKSPPGYFLASDAPLQAVDPTGSIPMPIDAKEHVSCAADWVDCDLRMQRHYAECKATGLDQRTCEWWKRERRHCYCSFLKCAGLGSYLPSYCELPSPQPIFYRPCPSPTPTLPCEGNLLLVGFINPKSEKPEWNRIEAACCPPSKGGTISYRRQCWECCASISGKRHNTYWKPPGYNAIQITRDCDEKCLRMDGW